MTAVLLWKEYRQQRPIWLAIAVLAVLLVVSLAATMGHAGGLQVFQEESLRQTLATVVLVLAISYGVVSGALLLAGENDEGTAVFLDGLTAQRGPLWARKFLAGVILTLSQSLALVVLSVALGFMDWQFALLVPLLAVDALAWGLLGGALCQRVLAAVLTGVAFMALSWFVVPLIGDSYWFLVAKAGAALTAGYVSWRRYSAVDRLRQPVAARPRQPRVARLPASVSVLLWLVWRQGRWLLVTCVVGAILLTATVHFDPQVIWPFGTTLLGLACGLSTFMDDQNDGARFLGAQRFPPGRIWAVKIVFWGAVLFVLTAAAWYVSVLALMATKPDITFFRNAATGYESSGRWWFEEWMRLEERTAVVSPVIFLGIWPVYAFSFGQYFAQVMRRPVLAGILAFFVSPLAGVWLPSLLFGGLHVWQVLVVPVLLLALTRLNQRPWLAGRLWSGKPLVVLIAGNVVVSLGLAGSLWYRVLEIPDVGEPFDVQTFTASLPSSEQNEGGRVLQRASLEMREYRSKVEKELPPPTGPLFPDDNVIQGGGAPGAAPPGAAYNLSYDAFLGEILTKGWPKNDREASRWLDRVFEGAWVQEAETAAGLPLGMIQNPRHSDGTDIGNMGHDCREMVNLLVARALQQEAQGDARAGLKHLETAFALARQVKHDAVGSLLFDSFQMEQSAQIGYQKWLAKIPRDQALLQEALAVLRRHEAANPSTENVVKAQYLSLSNNAPTFRGRGGSTENLLTTAYQVPWEKERQRRLACVLIAGQLRASELPLWQNPGWAARKTHVTDGYAVEAMLIDLPPKDGPGSRWSAEAWGELLLQFSLNRPRAAFFIPMLLDARRTETLRGAEVVTALAVYQAEHGNLPETLDALVPAYLPALPVNPVTGQSFSYRVSKGEKIENAYSPVTLVAGQGLVYGERPGQNFPVPYWAK